MDIQLALDPDLSLTAVDFAHAWNDTPDCAAAATARTTAVPATYHLPPELIASGMAVLGGISLNLVSDALYDLIKLALARRGVQQTTEIIQLEQPDGTKLLVIRINH